MFIGNFARNNGVRVSIFFKDFGWMEFNLSVCHWLYVGNSLGSINPFGARWILLIIVSKYALVDVKNFNSHVSQMMPDFSVVVQSTYNYIIVWL